MSMTDSAVRQLVIVLDLTEALLMSESISKTSAISRSMVDAMSFAESVGRASALVKIVADAITLQHLVATEGGTLLDEITPSPACGFVFGGIVFGEAPFASMGGGGTAAEAALAFIDAFQRSQKTTRIDVDQSELMNEIEIQQTKVITS